MSTDTIVALGLVAVLIIASRVAHILDGRGTLAASILGLVVGLAGHWTWLIVLLSFLLSGYVVTKWRWEEKQALGVAEGEEGERAWTNVIANGGVPMLVALLAVLVPDAGFGHADYAFIFTAAVAVAAADTFASEIGCLSAKVRMITNLESCEPGLNGGVSMLGNLAALGGAALIALIWFVLDFATSGAAMGLGPVLWVCLIGFLGCQVDSVLGAVLENRGYIGKGTVNALAIAAGALMASAVLLL